MVSNFSTISWNDTGGTRMSFTYATAVSNLRDPSTLLTVRWNTAFALAKPNGILLNSHCPFGVTNAVLYALQSMHSLLWPVFYILTLLGWRTVQLIHELNRYQLDSLPLYLATFSMRQTIRSINDWLIIIQINRHFFNISATQFLKMKLQNNV